MMRARAVAVGVVALTLGALASVAPVVRVVPTCAAAGAHHAALVVEHGDGSVVTSCVGFNTSEISGEQLVTVSGIAWSGQTFGGFGEAVCALDGEPARYVDCPGKDSYWAVFVSSGGGSWRLSNVGISSLVLQDGDAEGFRYVPSAGNPIAPTSPAGVCPAAVSVASPTAASSASAAPSADASSRATAPSPPDASPPPPSPSTVQTSAAPSLALATDSGHIAVAAATPGIARTSDANATLPPGGPDAGLLAASVAGGGLVGLALLRLIVGRRRRR